MKEIKQTNSKKCVDWFTSHIVVIAVIAFAIGLFLSSCHYAKAEDYTSEFWSDVENEMNNIYNGGYSVSGMQSALYSFAGNSYSTTISHYLKFPERNGNGVVYLASCYDYGIFIQSHEINGSNDSSGGYINFSAYYAYFNRGTISYQNDTTYLFFIYIQENRCGLFQSYNKGTGLVNAYYPYEPYNNGSVSEFYIGSDASINKLYGDTLRDVGDGRFYFVYDGFVSKGENNYYGDYTGRLLYFPSSPDYTSDTRLQFATWSNAFGKSILHVELTDYLNSTGFNISNTTLNDFTLSIEYSVKNSDDLETHSVQYNNSSEFYAEYGENGKLTRIYMNIPFTEFYGYSYDKNSFPDYDDVIIQNAIINLDLVPVGGSTSVNVTSYVDCLYYLQHVYDEIVPDVVPDPIYEDTIIYDTTIINDMKTSLHNKSSQYSFVSGDWVFIGENDLPTFENWASVFTNYVWFADSNSDTTYAGHWWQMANNIPSAADLSRPFDPSEWIELNKAFAFYDVIVLKVWRVSVTNVANVPVLQSYDLAGYLVLYSDRYYQHYEVENQLGIIEILQNDATNAVSFYDAIKTRVDDFETKTLSAITGEDNSIFAYINNFDNDLNSGISRIIDSMPVFNWTPFNDDDILNALYTIVANQNSPHDGYAKYISWVKDEQTSGGFGKWANDMFDVFHDAYDFFNYQDDINPNETGLQQYIDYVKLYMQYLTQGDEGIFPAQSVYYKGIFDNTYNLHNVNGRSG